MSLQTPQKVRNETLDWIKMGAACLVVWIHIKFPGTFGTTVRTVGLFCVPLFFAVSGYFSLNADCGVLKRRLFHILRITLAANAIYLLWEVYDRVFITHESGWDYVKLVFSPQGLLRFFLGTSTEPSGHLYFLASLLLCYGMLWIYVRFFGKEEVDYRPLFLVGFFTFIIRLCLEIFPHYSGLTINAAARRNFLFFGVPCFCLGLFLRKYQERILENFHWTWKKSLLVFGVAMAFNFLELYGAGAVDLSIGGTIAVIPLILFSAQYPVLPKSGILSPVTRWLGDISLVVYIVHKLVNYIIQAYSGQVPLFALALKHTYRYPVLVLLVSIGIGVLYCLVKSGWKRLKKRS